jgi:hypothetical protein
MGTEYSGWTLRGILSFRDITTDTHHASLFVVSFGTINAIREARAHPIYANTHFGHFTRRMLKSHRSRRRTARKGHLCIFTGGPVPEIRDADQPSRSLSVSDLSRRLDQAAAQAQQVLAEHFRMTSREVQYWVKAIIPRPPPSHSPSADDSLEVYQPFSCDFDWDGDPVWSVLDHNSGSA